MKKILKACKAYIKQLHVQEAQIKELTATNATIANELSWGSDRITYQNVTFQLVDGEGYSVDGTDSRSA